MSPSRTHSISASASPPESPNVLTPSTDLSPRLTAMTMANGGIDSLPQLDSRAPKVSSESNTIDLTDEPSTSTSPLPSPRLSGSRSPRTATFVNSTALPSAPGHHRGEKRNAEKGSLTLNASSSGLPSPIESPYGTPQRSPRLQTHFPLSSNGKARTGISSYFKEGFFDSTPFWLGLYFFFNLGLTLFNKLVLVSFPFPYTLTGLHALSGCAGTYIALERGAFVPARLTERENLILAAFSVLFTINIAVSNISLQLVTVPFHQVVRAATPLFTIGITAVFLRQRSSLRKLASLLPVVAGVGFATYGDYYFTGWGLIVTLLGTFLAALKTVTTNVLQTGGGGRLRLHPLDLLMRMSPLAFVQCVFYGYMSGELAQVRRYGATQMTGGKAIALLINGIIACGLNIVSFTANKKAGALTMTVSANCKQVLTIGLAVFLFNLHITFFNGIGILLTLCGGASYAYVEYQEKQRKKLVAEKAEKA